MSEDKQNTVQIPAKPSASKTHKTHTGLFSVLFVLIFIGFGLAAYFGYQTYSAVQTQNAAISELRNNTSKHARVLKDSKTNNENTQISMTQLASAVDTQLSKQQQELENISDQLSAIKGSTRKDWLLAEAEYLLRIANQRLLIEQDPIASESLLEAAEQILSEIDDAALMPVRIKIAEELLLLRSSPKGQIDKLLLQLNAVSTHVSALSLDTLPTQRTEGENDVTENNSSDVSSDTSSTTSTPTNSSEQHWWDRLTDKIVSALSRAISIKRTDKPITAPPSPAYEQYLKQNLALRIEQAKLLLMRNKFSDFEKSLTDSLAWSKQNLPTSKSTGIVIAELEKIASQRPTQQSTDISGSLDMLREIIEQKYREHSMHKNSTAELEDDSEAAVQKEDSEAHDATNKLEGKAQ